MKRLVFSPCDTFCADTEDNRNRYRELGYPYIDKLSKTDCREDTQHFLVATIIAGREVSYRTYILNSSFRNFDDLLGGINFDNVVLPKHQVDELTNLFQSHLGEVNSRELLAKIEDEMNRKLIADYHIDGYYYKVTGSESTVNCNLHRDIDDFMVNIYPNTMTVQEIELSKAGVETTECDIDVTTYDLKALSHDNRMKIGLVVMEDILASFGNNETRSIRLDLDENGKLSVNNLVDWL